MVHDGGGTAGRFAARARRRRLRALVPLLAAMAAVAVVLTAGWVVLGTGVFDVRTIAVEGAATMSRKTVLEAAAVRAGSPLARVDVDGVKARVSALGPVERVVVYRTWPHTLTVQITERKPVAVVARRGAYVVLDATGMPFRRSARRYPGVPLLELKAPGPADRATKSALTVASALTPELRRQLVRIAAPTAEQVTVVLRRRTVFWGDATDNVRKATVATALLARPGRQLDVSAPDIVTVR
jgi:cell division protein FtsQ